MYASVLCQIILGQNAGVGVGVVATDDDDGFEVELFADFEAFVELLCFFEFGATRADDVEATCVAIFVDDVGGEFDVFVVYEARGTAEEAVEFALCVQCLDAIKDARDDVVSTRSLTTREDNANVKGLALDCALTFLEGHDRHSVGVGE